MKHWLREIVAWTVAALATAVSPHMRGATAACSDDNPHSCECDRVHHLPGFDAPLPSPWYSGYLTYDLDGHTIHTHYVLVMAERLESESVHTKKPLIYWTNGGPGASSLFGLLTEIGPLWLNENSFQKDKSLPSPLYNPYGWTRLGHVVMIDQPAPVGFSYCEGDDKCSDISWTDELAAQNVSFHLGPPLPRAKPKVDEYHVLCWTIFSHSVHRAIEQCKPFTTSSHTCSTRIFS